MNKLRKKSFINLAYKGLAYLVLASLFFGQTSFIYAQEKINEANVSATTENTSNNDSAVNLEAPDINIRDLVPLPLEEPKEITPETTPKDVDEVKPIKTEDQEEEPEPESMMTGAGGEETFEKTQKIDLEKYGVKANSDGSFGYSYKVETPKGRSGIEPSITLDYSSNSKNEDSVVGFGWNISIPSIERVNKYGSDELYNNNDFTSSLSGELVNVSGNDYASKIDNGDFLEYEYDSTGDFWTVLDKNGTKYTFGENASARMDDPSDATRIYKWMLENVEDTNGNFMVFTYDKDDGQIYPENITYTNHSSLNGIYEVIFHKDVNFITTPTRVFYPGFKVQTNYLIEQIEIITDGAWNRKYDLVYSDAPHSVRTLLDSITESGNDGSNVITLEPTIFTYQEFDFGWSYDSAWDVHIPFEGDIDEGAYQFGNINGDALIDVLCGVNINNVTCSGNNNGVVMTNDSTQWVASSGSPMFIDNQGDDSGMRLMDINGDGLDDLVRNNDNLTNDPVVELNNGSGWTVDSNWQVPVPFVGGNIDPGAYQFGDVNGDGLIDIVCLRDDTGGLCNTSNVNNKVYLNDGTSWVASYWGPPTNPNTSDQEYFIDQNGNDTGLRLIDLNNDGLIDMERTESTGGSTFTYFGYLNNGVNTWMHDSSLTPGLNYDNGSIVEAYSFGDVNGDGYSDIACGIDVNNLTCGSNNSSIYFFNGNYGWDEEPGSYPSNPNNSNAEFFADNTGHDTGLRLVDVDGDGLSDMVKSKTSNGSQFDYFVYKNTGLKDNLLSTVTLPEGGIITAEYLSSTEYKNGSTLLNPNLPVSLDTVSALTYDDNNGVVATHEYEYGDGHYYFSNPQDRRVAGFGYINETDPDGNITKTYFHQGNGDNSSSGEVNDSEYKIGKPYLVEQYDTSNNLYKSTINVWDEDLTNRNFVFLSEKITLDSDGNNSVHKDSAEVFTYDNSNGNLLTHVEYGEGAYSSGVFSDTGTDDRTTTYLYATGSSNNVIGMPYSEITTDNSSAVIKETQYHYDGQSFGNVTLGNLTDIYKLISGSTYSHEQKDYNIGMGLVTDFTDANSKTTHYDFDTYKLYPEAVTDGNANVVRYSYDYSSGKVTKKIDANSNIWTTIYDGLDRVLEDIIPGPSASQITKTEYFYNDSSIPNSATKLNYLDGSITSESIAYIDGLGRTIQERSQGESDYSVVDTVYDSKGRVWKKSLPYFDSGSTYSTATTNPDLYTENIYDPLDRVISSTNAVGTTGYVYDHWKTTVTDANNHDKSFYKDAYNNLIQVDEDDGNGIASTYYDWDMLGNLINITDALGNVRNFTYDNLSRRLTAEDLHDSTDIYFGTWTYTYDDVGNLATVTDPNSNYVTYTYDGINRILSEDLSSSTGTDISYTYGGCTNGTDRLCSVLLLSGDGTDYDYDEVGNIVFEDRTISAMSNVTNYTYGYQNNLTTITDPYSNLTEYTYNPSGRIESINFTVNGGAVQSIIDNFDYSPLGQITEQNQSNGITIVNTYTQNELYRLENKLTTDGSTVFQDIDYRYDPVGNILQIQENSLLDSGRIADYEYDWLNRLLQAEITSTVNSQDYTQIFRYDAVGNIAQKDFDTYDYDGNTGTLMANPHAVTSIGIIGYSYDNSGNLVSDGTFTYTWNYKNQMTQAASSGITANYTYDENGQRTSTNDGSILTIYPNKYLDFDVNYSRSHVYAGEQLVATIDQGGVHYNSPDHLNSSAVITDSSGNLEQLLDYYPFGEVRLNNQSASFNERNKYIGQEFDEETGLNYMNSRYQNGSIGKFISQDPVFLEVGNEKKIKEKTKLDLEKYLSDPQGLNSYSYARNNPLIFTDKNGEYANLLLGAGATMLAQYGYDVYNNIAQNGLSINSLNSNLSSVETYGVRAVQGSIVAASGGLSGGLSIGSQMGIVGVTSGVSGVLGNAVLGNNSSFGSIAIDTVIGGITAGIVKTIPGVNGVLPKFGTESFMVGKHTQQSASILGIESGSGFLSSILADIYSMFNEKEKNSSYNKKKERKSNK